LPKKVHFLFGSFFGLELLALTDALNQETELLGVLTQSCKQTLSPKKSLIGMISYADHYGIVSML